MTVAKKMRLKGFRNVHYAKITNGQYDAPVHLKGGKKINVELNYESEEYESDDIIDEQEYIFTGGEGTLALKSLLPSEYALLFSNEVDEGEVTIRTSDIPSNGALLFERQKRNSKDKRLYVLYNTKFAPSAIAAESVGKGGGEIDEELKFSVGETEDNLLIYFLDTDLASEEQKAKIENWYKAVQFPGKNVMYGVAKTGESKVNESKVGASKQ